MVRNPFHKFDREVRDDLNESLYGDADRELLEDLQSQAAAYRRLRVALPHLMRDFVCDLSDEELAEIRNEGDSR
jgi:hypothetical protein